MVGWIKKLKLWLGYIWMVAALSLSIIGFINLESVAEVLIVRRGFQITENWRGGKISSVGEHGDYRTIFHEPVFEGWLTEKKRGFIRIDWTSDKRLPVRIIETVDYDRNGKVDFTIRLNTSDNKVDFHSNRGKDFMIADEKLLVFDKSRSLRIKIKERH